MGMYDNINYTCRCPVCDHLVTGFQSKDGDCMLKTLEHNEVGHFYSSCDVCDVWIEFDKQANGKFEMSEPNLYLVKDIITKEDMLKHINDKDRFIRAYCNYKLMPKRRITDE